MVKDQNIVIEWVVTEYFLFDESDGANIRP